MIIYYENQPGYNEPRLQQTNLAGSKLFIVTESVLYSQYFKNLNIA